MRREHGRAPAGSRRVGTRDVRRHAATAPRLHQRDDGAAEPAAGEARAEDAGIVACERDEQVHVGRGDLVVVAQRDVRRVEETPEVADGARA
jgi:hypothetical protein